MRPIVGGGPQASLVFLSSPPLVGRCIPPFRRLPDSAHMAQNVVVPPFDVAPETVVGSTPQSVFPFDFPFWNTADIIPLVDGSPLTAGFTVAGYPVQNGQPVEGGYGSGVVTLNTPVSNCIVTIDRFVRGSRESQFSRAAPLGMPSLNADLNKLTARQQDMNRRLEAAIMEAGDSIGLIGKAGTKGELISPVDFRIALGLSDAEIAGIVQGEAVTITGGTRSLTPNDRAIASVLASEVADPAGGADCRAAIANLAANAGVGRIVFGPGTYLIASTGTWPGGVTYETLPGAVFSISTGVTLTIAGDFVCPMWRQVFTGPGTVANLRTVTLEMFGGAADGNFSNPTAYTGTDNAAAWAKARAVLETADFSYDNTDMPTLQLGVGGYLFDSNAFFYPTLARPFRVVGAGSSGGSGSHIGMRGGSFGAVATCIESDLQSNAEYEMRGFLIAFADANASGVFIVGNQTNITGLTSANLMNGVMKSRITDVVIQEGEFLYCNARQLKLDNLSIRRLRTQRMGSAMTIRRTGDAAFCGDIEGTVEIVSYNGTSQVALDIDNIDTTTSLALGEIRGVRLSSCTSYNLGGNVRMQAAATSARRRNIGDTWFNSCQLHGSVSTYSTGWGVDILAYGYAEVEAPRFLDCYINYMANGIRGRQMLFDGVYGRILFPTFTNMQFQYIKERIAEFEGGTAGLVTGTMRDCGGSTASLTTHCQFSQTSGFNVLLKAVQIDTANWPGLATGISITGAATRNMVTSGCLIGTTTAVSDTSGGPGNVSTNTGLKI